MPVNTHIHGVAKALILLVAAIGLGACAGVHLHNAANAEQAAIASTSFAASAKQEEDSFAAQAKSFEALAVIDQQSAERYADEMRQARLTEVVGSDKTLREVWFDKIFADRLIDLKLIERPVPLGEVKAALEQARPNSIGIAASRLGAYEKTKRRILDEVSTLQAAHAEGEKPKPIICTATQGIPADVDTSGLDQDTATWLKKRYELLRKNCEDYRAAVANQPQWHRDETAALQEIQEERAQAVALQEEAAKQVTAAIAAVKATEGEPEGPSPGARLKEIAAKANEILAIATDFQKAVFKEATLEESLKCVNEALSAAAGAPVESEDPCLDADAAAIVTALPQLIDTAHSIEVELHRPNLAGVQIVKRVLEGQLAAAKERVRFEDDRLKFEEERIGARLEEVRAYLELVGEINEAMLDRPCVKADERTRAVVSVQITTAALAEQKMLEIEYAKIARIYEYALSVSRAHAQSWRGLIEPLIAQQKAFHDSGIKPQELAALLVQVGQIIALEGIADQIGK